MKWINDYNMEKSKISFELLIEANQKNIDFNELKAYKIEYSSLNIELNKNFNETLQELKVNNISELKGNTYKFDCLFALRIYQTFQNDKYKMEVRDASNDNIWRYIQMCVVQNLIYERWGLNPNRFYDRNNRIYLKVLWWYIYLSWNKSIDKTKEIILSKANSSDTIVQLVERVGDSGYRIELYRKIMEQKSMNLINQDEFRKFMVLNSARIKIINPFLMNGGVEEYVQDLISSIRS
jgi:hypothetical protein